MSKNKTEKDFTAGDGSYQVKKNKKLNIFAFIVCVFVAFFVWVYVMNTQNDDYTKTFTLDVEVLNSEALLEASNLSVFGIPNTNVTVTIRGKKADVRKYIEKDFRAYLDLSSIKKKGAMALGVGVETPSASLSVVNVEPASVNVYVDTMTAKVLVPTPKSDNPDKLVLSLAADNPTIEISGPSSYMEKIASAEVYVPYSKTYNVGDSVTTTDIRLYGSDDEQLPTLYMTFLNESVIVKVDMINE